MVVEAEAVGLQGYGKVEVVEVDGIRGSLLSLAEHPKPPWVVYEAEPEVVHGNPGYVCDIPGYPFLVLRIQSENAAEIGRGLPDARVRGLDGQVQFHPVGPYPVEMEAGIPENTEGRKGYGNMVD